MGCDFDLATINVELARRSRVSVGRKRVAAADVIGTAKDAFWLARDDYRTFSAWVEDALRRHVDHTKHVRSVEQIPVRPSGPLPTGRPVD